MQIHKALRHAVLCFCVLAVSPVCAQQTSAPAASGPPQIPGVPLPADANTFVREAIGHELKAEDQDHTHWMYRIHREDEKGSQDREVLETKDGDLARTLLINGQPLNQDERSKDDQRMQKLVASSEDRSRRSKRSKSDGDKARQMLKALPDAFNFRYDGSDDDLVRLSFTPNPNYDPPSREMQVFHAMTGKIWIQPTALRLARIDGTLFQDVTFGWGLLGRLNKGGTFHVVQRNVGDNHWTIVELDVSMQGHAIIFKSINVKQRQFMTDFHRVADNLTIAQAYNILEKNQGAASTAEGAAVR